MQISPSVLFLVHDSIKDPTYKQRINKPYPIYDCVIPTRSSALPHANELVSSLNAGTQPSPGLRPWIHLSTCQQSFTVPVPTCLNQRVANENSSPLEKNYTPQNTDYIKNKRKQGPGLCPQNKPIHSAADRPYEW